MHLSPRQQWGKRGSVLLELKLSIDSIVRLNYHWAAPGKDWLVSQDHIDSCYIYDLYIPGYLHDISHQMMLSTVTVHVRPVDISKDRT